MIQSAQPSLRRLVETDATRELSEKRQLLENANTEMLREKTARTVAVEQLKTELATAPAQATKLQKQRDQLQTELTAAHARVVEM